MDARQLYWIGLDWTIFAVAMSTYTLITVNTLYFRLNYFILGAA